jgi:TolB-like protein/DNA-binding SARP family transcriptional activator
LLDYALDSLLKLAQLDAVDGLYGRALAYARRALELDPLREDAHRQVMRCLAAMNQRSKALRQYEAARQLLASELGVSPEEETQTLHKEIIQGRGGLADRTLVSAAMPVNPKFVKVGPRRLRARLGMPSRLAAALTFTFFAIIIANVAWHVQHQSSLTELPSIAVMPFTNAGGNRLRPTGMTEEITTLLTTNPGVEVVANDKLPKLARLLRPEPDPRFRLQGSVHASDQGLQVNVQLIDAATGTHLWADRLQAEGASLDAMEEQLAYRIYESLVGFTGEIARQEQRLAWSKPENSLEAYDYAMRGLQFALQAGKESQLKALAAYQQGLKKFPNSTRLRFYLAFAYRRIVEAGWSETPDRDLETAWKLAVEASLSPHRSRYEQWLSHWIMAKLAQWCKADFERSVAEAMAADKMVPYDATTRADLAELMANAGRTAEAIAWLQESIRRDPLGPEWYRNNLAWAYYLAGRYEDALAEMQALNKPRRLLIAAIYARLGRSKEARAMMVRYLAELPQQTLRNEARWPLVEPLKSGWLADLRQAGLPQ